MSLRLVTDLERRYPDFPGLNLTWEVREGLVKHTTAYDTITAHDYEPECRASLEAQVVNAADEIAYNTHDLDDGLRAGLLSPSQLAGVTIWEESCARVGVRPDRLAEMDRRRIIRDLINAEVTDLLNRSSQGLLAEGIGSPQTARNHPADLIAFSAALSEKNRQLRRFLLTYLYRHYRVARMSVKAQRLVGALFSAYLEEPSQLPQPVQRRLENGDPHRVVCDYVAGMTDRFALQEYRKLFDPEERT
jgi:dGTPase